MLDFATVKLNKKILNQWIDANLNVCLIGRHGCGKSTIISEVFNERKLKWKYFSGATLDPWTDVVGIPTVAERNGLKTIDYILPHDMSDDLEAIFIDEYNRSKISIRNAVLELVQFKSINGRKFPNLKCVWVAINPEVEDVDNSYDVERLDDAQLDRFHIIVRLPDEPDKLYFSKKFGARGTSAVEWWKDQPAKVKQFVSARRLEYVIDAYHNNLDIMHLLPASSNVDVLKKSLSEDDVSREFYQLIKEKSFKALGEFLSDINKFNRFKNDVPQYEYLRFVHKDILDYFAQENSMFSEFRDSNRGKSIFSNSNNSIDVNTLELIKEFQKKLSVPDIIANANNFSQHYHWASNNLTNEKKVQLYRIAWEVLHLIPFDGVAVGKLQELLIAIGSCQTRTLSTFPHLLEFTHLSRLILVENGIPITKETFGSIYQYLEPNG